jgi:CAP-Gly domain-containing linker protein 1
MSLDVKDQNENLVKNFEKQKNDLTSLNVELEAKYTKLKAEFDDQTQQSQNLVSEKIKQIENLKGEAAEEKLQLQKRIETLDNELKQMNEEKSKLKGDFETLKEELTKLRNENINKADEATNNLREELDQYKQLAISADEKRVEAENENKQNVIDLETRMSEVIHEYEEESENKKKDYILLKEQFDSLETELTAYKERITHIENENEILLDQIEMLKTRSSCSSKPTSATASSSMCSNEQTNGDNGVTNGTKFRLGSVSAKTAAPRLFCDICDEFDLHDTEDCPGQMMTTSTSYDTNKENHQVIKSSNRTYCDLCEQFGHEESECPTNDSTIALEIEEF